MTPKSKTSAALLGVWVLLIASLVGVTVFLYLRTRPDKPEEDPPVSVVPQPKKPTPKPPIPRSGRGSTDPSTSRPKAPRRLEIHGIVKNPAGEVVGGASVAVYLPTRPNQGRTSNTPPNMDEIHSLNDVVYIETQDWDAARPLSQWTAGEDQTRTGETPFSTDTSKADGTFTVSVPNSGPMRLTASKEGVGSAAANNVQAGADKIELTLGPGTQVSGLVLTDVDSVPVENARVTFDNGNRVFSTTTDSSGHFVAEGVTPGQYSLTVAAKERTPLMESNYRIHANDPSPITLRMPRGTLLRIKALVERPGEGSIVVDPKTKRREVNGDPVPNAQIVALCRETLAYVMGRTDSQGMVEFKGLPAGSWQIGGTAQGFTQVQEVEVHIDKNQLTFDETFEFEPAEETVVQVVDEDGRPLAGVEFMGVNSDDAYDQLRSSKIGVTDQDGKIKVVFQSDGPRHSVYGFKQGFAMVHVAYEDIGEPEEPVKLVAKKPIRVHGKVTNPDGKAVPHAVVEVTISPETADFLTLELRTDGDGRYEFANLPRTDGITLSARTEDDDVSEDVDVEPTEGKTDYQIDLPLLTGEEPTETIVPAAKPGLETEKDAKK